MTDRCEKCGSRAFCLCLETDGQVILAMFVAVMLFAVALGAWVQAQPKSFLQGD